MGKIKIYVLMIILLSQLSLANIIINEIMADPVEDSYNEWIELYNDDITSINLSNWVIGDDSDDDLLIGGYYYGSGTILEPGQYAIITDESTRVYNNFEVSESALRLYVDDSSIGGYGLSNNGETIYLYDNNNNLEDSVSYLQVDEENSYAFVNNSWYEATPTPGYNNNGSVVYEPEGECDWEIEILINKTLFDNETEFEFKVRATNIHGNKTNISAVVLIDDIYGNNKKSYSPWTNESATRQKTSSVYSPNLDDEIYVIKANLTTLCVDADISDNYAEELFSIADEPLETESSLEIEKIYDLGSDKVAKFGQTIRVKAHVYKGDTTKNSIVLYVENRKDRISKQSKTNVYTKYTDYNLVVPIQLKANCNEVYEDDDYYVYIKGLDKEDRKEIEVEGITDSLCEEIEAGSSITRSDFSYELIDFPIEIENNKSFISKLELDNDGDDDLFLEVWSYVYRGSKCYSGEREENKINVEMPSHSQKTAKLYNTVYGALPGDYKLKVKIKQSNLLTEKEITKDIVVVSSEQIYNNVNLDDVKYLKKGVVYESSSVKAAKLVPYLIILLTTLLSIVLIWKR